MPSQIDVVITGVGIISPIGIGIAAFAESLRLGRSGVRTLPKFVGTPLPVQFGGVLSDFDLKSLIAQRKSLKLMCREAQWGVAAAGLAVADSGIDSGNIDPERFGVVYGSEMFYGDLEELAEVYRNCVSETGFDFDRWGERMMSDIFPLWLLRYLPNMPACHISIAHGARGPTNSITLGDVSSMLAIIEAAAIIRRGQADLMIAGGAGSRLHPTPLLYRGDSNLSHRGQLPEAACRPFDAARDGMVNGEGAGAFVLESRHHAEKRGAVLKARILGEGMSCEPLMNGQANRGRGIRNAIQAALRGSHLSANQIGHVNAHGVSTIPDDIVEAQAIRNCLGDVPVTAPKSFFGNLGAGTGAVEMAVSVLSLATGEVPPTLNYSQPDPDCPVNVVRGEPIRTNQRTALALGQSSGTGQAAAIAIGEC